MPTPFLDAWYPGEEGGAAVAETLSGKNNPAGRLPVTFYKGVDQLPNFEDYGMANRTYRYFTGKPLYPFGYGLSYTTFSYSDLSVPAQAIAAGQPLAADVTVTNTGKLAGDEVVQLYLRFPAVKGAPRIALRGFQRIHLEPGASTKVHFDLKARDLGMVTEDGNPIVAQGDYTISIGGGQPETGAPGVKPGTSTLTDNTPWPNRFRRPFVPDCTAGGWGARAYIALHCVPSFRAVSQAAANPTSMSSSAEEQMFPSTCRCYSGSSVETSADGDEKMRAECVLRKRFPR